MHSLRDRLARVVGPALHLRPVQQPLDQHVLRHLEGDHEVDLVALLRQHLVQRPCLLQGAREAVQQHVRADVRVAQDALDDADDQVVRHEVAGAHDPLRLLADLAAPRDLGAQDVAGRQVRQLELPLDVSRLRALAASRRPEDQPDHSVSSFSVRRRSQKLRDSSSSSECRAGSGPAGAPSSLSCSQRLVIST